jgi:hypothetical protein
MRTKFSFDILKGKDHSEELGIDDRIVLNWILRKQEVVAGSCEHGNDSSGCMKGGMCLTS